MSLSNLSPNTKAAVELFNSIIYSYLNRHNIYSLWFANERKNNRLNCVIWDYAFKEFLKDVFSADTLSNVTIPSFENDKIVQKEFNKIIKSKHILTLMHHTISHYKVEYSEIIDESLDNANDDDCIIKHYLYCISNWVCDNYPSKDIRENFDRILWNVIHEPIKR